MTKRPRPYQQERIDEAARRLIAGETCAIVLPTGVGKTVTALWTIDRVLSSRRAVAGRALWLVDLRELVGQTERAAAQLSIPVEVRTVQTRRAIRPGDFDVIVVDEAHKFLTEIRTQKLVDSETPLLGLTATPRRGDGKHIASLFGGDYVCGPYTLGQAILDGWLCDAKVLRVELLELDLDRVKRTAHDFDHGELAEAMNVPAHNAEIVRRWREEAWDEDTRTFALSNLFAVDTAHADALCEEVNRQCGEGTCAAIHTNLPTRDGHKRIARFREGAWPCVASVMMVAEGFDHPPLQIGVLARPTKSERLLVQMLGRFLRPHAGKPHATILDCEGSYQGLDLASIYDVIERPDADEPALTEDAVGLGEEGCDGIPMLTEVISRVRELDLFRRGIQQARQLPWVRVEAWEVRPGLVRGCRYALPVRGGFVVVAPAKADPTRCCAAYCYTDRQGWACWDMLADTVPEAEAFRTAERWTVQRFGRYRAYMEDRDAIKRTRDWFRDVLPPSDRTAYRLEEHGLQIPRQHGRAQRLIRQLYARGAIARP